MKVLQLKGHERGLNCLKFNSDGDLLFTSSKDTEINCWFTEDGVRLGTFNGHTGAIWDLDVDKATERLFSASSDASVRLWDCRTGTQLFRWVHHNPVRTLRLSSTEDRLLTCTDNVMSKPPCLQIFRLSDDVADQSSEPLTAFECGTAKIVQAVWGPADEKIFMVGESTTVDIWDVETQKRVHQIRDHSKTVTSIELSQDGCFFLTGSHDFTARLYDTRSYTPIKTYLTGRPCNGASLSPLLDHVFIGGGQSAAEVTGTRTDPAQFATRIFHKIWAEELGLIPGHFGTVNAVQCSPNGRQFATGGEDGYIRLNFLDDTYFQGLSDASYLKALAERLEA